MAKRRYRPTGLHYDKTSIEVLIGELRLCEESLAGYRAIVDRAAGEAGVSAAFASYQVRRKVARAVSIRAAIQNKVEWHRRMIALVASRSPELATEPVRLPPRRGGKRKGVDMSNLEVIEKQLNLIVEQAAVARAMIQELRSGGAGSQPAAPALSVVKHPPFDPVAALRVQLATFIAAGGNWESSIDRCDQSLVESATRQFCFHGPGNLGAGRRDPTKFREYIMKGVPVPGKAA
jgi:hypothetical protein